MYVINYPSLQRRNTYKLVVWLGKRVKNDINVVLSNNQGKSLVFYYINYMLGYDECSHLGFYLGKITYLYNDVLTTLKSGFRYTNGNPYFFSEHNVYVYNGFLGYITKLYIDIFNILKIMCMKEKCLRDLYFLFSEIFYFRT